MRTGKSWVAYLLSGIKLMLEAGFIVALLFVRPYAYWFLGGILNRKVDFDDYLIPLCGLLMLYFIACFVHDIAVLRSVVIQTSENGVCFKSGILPWKKQEFFWSYSQLFRASYRHSFFGWLFNYGHITLTDSKGTTSFSTQFFIHNAKTLASEINFHIMQDNSLKS